MITNPTPQRALRGHCPKRPTPRTASSGDHHAMLAARLTPRDRWLARMLHEHRVLTTGQITQLAWPTERATNHRLRQLYLWRVIDRFQPFITSGTAPMHYVLDTAGATALAHEDGIDPKTTGYRHDRAIGIAHSLRLAHTVGTNSVFAALIAHARRPDTSDQLTAWWSEHRCMNLWGDIVRPDAYARWGDIEFFLEYDFGTETLSVLASKLAGYHQLARTTRITTPILVWLPTPHREATARRALATARDALDQPALIPIATTSTQPTGITDPTADRWLPIPAHGQPAGRLRLAELARAWPHLTPLSAVASAAPRATTQPAGLRPPRPMPPEPSRR